MADLDLSPEAIRKATQNQPMNQAGAGVVVKNNDVGIAAGGNVDIGKPGGWTVAGTLQWMKDAGKSAALWFDWRGK